MENRVKAIDFIENPEYVFTMFQPRNKKQDKFSVIVPCSGYNDLFCIISKLLKVAIAALEYEEEGRKDIAALLELIHDLIPLEEGNLLDTLYKQFLQTKNQPEASLNV